MRWNRDEHQLVSRAYDGCVTLGHARSSRPRSTPPERARMAVDFTGRPSRLRRHGRELRTPKIARPEALDDAAGDDEDDA